MTDATVIRQGGAGDLALLRSWLVAEGLPVDDLTPAHLDDFLILQVRDAPVGAIGLEQYGDIGLLRSLVVSEAARGAGAGGRLVAALEAAAREQGVGELWLLTIDADAWFARLGYRVRTRDRAPAAIRATREFSGLCPGDAVLMSKTL